MVKNIENSKLNKQIGFTLIEVLVGITILIVGFIPVYMLIFSSEKSSVETVRNVQALMYAHTLLEEIAHVPYSMIPETNGIQEEIEFKLNFEKLPAFSKIFTPPPKVMKDFFYRKIEITSGDQYKIIKVIVVDKYIDRTTKGKRGKVILETLVIK